MRESSHADALFLLVGDSRDDGDGRVTLLPPDRDTAGSEPEQRADDEDAPADRT